MRKAGRKLPVCFFGGNCMKRILCLLSAIILLLTLPACGKGSHTLSPGYEGEIQMTDGEMNCTGVLEADGESLTLSLTSPESVRNLRYEFTGGELHTRLEGLDCITQPGGLPLSSPARLLYEVFSQTDKAAYQSAENGEELFTLDTAAGTATITAKNGKPQVLTLGNRMIRFTEE